MENIDLDAIIREIYAKDNGKTFGKDKFKMIARECIHQALILASEKASLIHCYPLEGTEDEPVLLEIGIKENKEAHYTSPWVNKASILDVEKLIK